LVQVTGLFIAQSYMHHVDCAYINSSEKVDDSCSWSARSILQLLRQLIEGLVRIGQLPDLQLGRKFETCMTYELERNVDFWKYTICLDMADKSTYGEGRGHICGAFHFR
jgi:hypothetical protein